MEKVVVIGATAAGSSFAAKLKRLNQATEIELYEKRSYPSLGACGLPYYIGGMLDNPTDLIARSEAQFRQDGIDIRCLQEVLEVSAEKKELVIKDGKTNQTYRTRYDKLIIASGASPLIPELYRVQHSHVMSLHDLEDGIQLKSYLKDENIKSIALIGGGYIGLELAENMYHYDKKIHIIDISSRLLEKTFDQGFSDAVLALMQEKNINVHLNRSVDRIAIENGVLNGLWMGSDFIQVDLVIVATGVRPNTQFIENIDKLENGAIIIDDYGQTSIKDIYAIGDCAIAKHQLKGDSYIPLATVANKYGRHLASIINGDVRPLPKMLAAAALKLFDTELARVGLTKMEADMLGLETCVTVVKDLNHPSYYPGASPIMLEVIYDQNSRIILGGQAMGQQGVVAKIDVLSLAISKEIKIDELKLLDFPYAPPFSRTWHLINTMANVSK